MRLLLAVALVATCVACGTKPKQGNITVFAASSLTEAFTAIAKSAPAKVTFNFAASSELALQLRSGASADVLATADDATMRSVRTFTQTPVEFTRNRLEIVIRKHLREPIRTITDLADPRLTVAFCAPQVPCGVLTRRALKRAHVLIGGASQEENVKAVLTKVELGEADAGIVYASDVRAAGSKVVGVELPPITTSYPIAVLRSTKDEADARAFVDLVLSPAGQRILARYGFLPVA